MSPREGVRDHGRERSPPAPEPAGGPTSGSRPVGNWRSKDLYLGVSTAQVTGNPKGTSVGKEAALSQVRPREPVSVLMMANREVANTELGPYPASAENQDCSQPMDDIQVSAGEASPPRLGRPPPPPRPSRPTSRGRAAASPVAGWKSGLPCEDAERPLCLGHEFTQGVGAGRERAGAAGGQGPAEPPAPASRDPLGTLPWALCCFLASGVTGSTGLGAIRGRVMTRTRGLWLELEQRKRLDQHGRHQPEGAHLAGRRLP